jgi:hypothetical protein
MPKGEKSMPMHQPEVKYEQRYYAYTTDGREHPISQEDYEELKEYLDVRNVKNNIGQTFVGNADRVNETTLLSTYIYGVGKRMEVV